MQFLVSCLKCRLYAVASIFRLRLQCKRGLLRTHEDRDTFIKRLVRLCSYSGKVSLHDKKQLSKQSIQHYKVP